MADVFAFTSFGTLPERYEAKAGLYIAEGLHLLDATWRL